MSDNGRKDLHTKVKEAITPNATKSRAEKVKEATTDSADRAARDAQPDSTKSVTQKVADKTERVEDNTIHGSTHETIGDKVKNALHVGKKTSYNGRNSSIGEHPV